MQEEEQKINELSQQDLINKILKLEKRVENLEFKQKQADQQKIHEMKKQKLLKIFSSQILINPADIKQVLIWLGKRKFKFKLLYRSVKDGLNALSFHQTCDNQGPNLIFAQVKLKEKNYIIGGYCTKSWQLKGGPCSDDEGEGFLFSLKSKKRYKILKERHQQAYSHRPDSGPIFGHNQHDLHITGEGKQSFSNLGVNYSGQDTEFELVGEKYFDVVNYEVYSAKQVVDDEKEEEEEKNQIPKEHKKKKQKENQQQQQQQQKANQNQENDEENLDLQEDLQQQIEIQNDEKENK